MSGTSNLPASLPHWVLELIAIGLGVGLVVLGHTSYGAGADFGGGALVGAGVGGLIHDLSA